MRKGEKKYLIIFIILFVGYVATDFLAPKPIDWSVTFGNTDKNPFGGFILNERSADLFTEQFEVSNLTISEISGAENILILADYAEIAGADYRSLKNKLDSGTNVFIAANSFSTVLRDSLDFDISFSFHLLDQNLFEAATSRITLRDSLSYEYPFSLVSNYFLIDEDTTWQTMATLEDNSILVWRNVGKGKLILSSTPYVFTNFGLLFNENYPAAASMLSLLQDAKRTSHFSIS